MISSGAFALVAVAGTSSCSDDPVPVATQDAYDETAVRLCERNGGEVLADASNLLDVGNSDAQIISFIRTEYVPNIRAIVRGLNRNGFPADKAATYAPALSQVLEAVSEIDDEDEAYRLLDRLRGGTLEDEDNPLLRVQASMEEADIDCGRQAPDLESGTPGG